MKLRTIISALASVAVLLVIAEGSSCKQNESDSAGKSAELSRISEVSTDSAFTEIVGKNPGRLLVFKLYADWCGPCKMLKPTIEKIARENPEAQFYEINVDKLPKVAASFGVSAIPLVVFVKDGKAVWGAEGIRSESEYVNAIKMNSGKVAPR